MPRARAWARRGWGRWRGGACNKGWRVVTVMGGAVLAACGPPPTIHASIRHPPVTADVSLYISAPAAALP